MYKTEPGQANKCDTFYIGYELMIVNWDSYQAFQFGGTVGDIIPTSNCTECNIFWIKYFWLAKLQR